MGASLDWSKTIFTMDEQSSFAVQEAFIQLYEKNIIYRSNKIVNWSCKLSTAISDVEVDNLNIEGPTKIKVPNHD